MTRVRFSALITSYNYRAFVCDAVASTLAQTHAPHEVIVVDDGSTDDSVALLTERFAHEPTVRIVPQENGGQLAAFTAGCRVATGDVVCFLDADDLWESTYLETLSSLYGAKEPPDLILANLQRFGAAQGLWHQRSADVDCGLTILPAWYLRTIPQAPTSSISIRRTLAARILDLPDAVRSDWRTRADDCLLLGAQILGGRTVALARPLVRYRVHGKNNWMQQTLSALAMARYKLAISVLADLYAERAGLTPRLLGYAFLEFKTKPHATGRDLLTYLWLQYHAPQPLTRLVRPVAAMLKHYLQRA